MHVLLIKIRVSSTISLVAVEWRSLEVKENVCFHAISLSPFQMFELFLSSEALCDKLSI